MIEERKHGNLRYLISLPQKFDPQGKYPVVFHTHGAGSRGDQIELLTHTGPLKEVLAGRLQDAIVVAPQCFSDSWFDIFEQLIEFCEYIYSQSYVDQTRFYASGISMGGYAILQLMISRPSLWTAGMVCCGAGMYWNAARLKSIPLWLFAGALDVVVFPQESIYMANEINKSGGNAKLTIYDHCDHNCWDNAYSDPAVFEWLFQQQKEG